MDEPKEEQSGLDGSDKRLPENCVEYLLFLIEGNIDARKQLSRLEELRKKAAQLTNDLTKEYIWQRGDFKLETKNENGLIYLRGLTDYGDSVEDEWLVVYILRELTRSHPSLWVRVFDSDGEFLLVEAANVLPKWLNPEMDYNRVWVHDGKLRIIPFGEGSDPKLRSLSLVDACQVLKSSPESLVSSDLIEAEAFYRLEKYPEQISRSLHYSMTTIPRKLAYVLHERPKAIAPAVEAFYLRDPTALKPLISASGNLHFPPDDMVTVSVKFTKVLFAQLRSQRFDPPPRWEDKLKNLENKELARLEMGMKLTCGLEMMVNNLDKTDSRVAREFGIILEDLQEDGAEALPADEDIKTWKDASRDDDEAWMDINYDDFEQELDGKRPQNDSKSRFGDATAQADLRKLVSRFESFLNDDSAGLDGADVDDMDFDDDDDSGSDGDSEDDDEDKAVSFDEQEFSRMMREMMGLPTPSAAASQPATSAQNQPTPAQNNQDQASDEEDEQAIKQLTAQMQAELNEHGVLKLDSTPKNRATLKGKEKEVSVGQDGTSKPAISREQGADDEESEDDEVDIDYNLAKNLLESFKSQAGMAGPTGNILGMMGIQLPRDEDDGDSSQGKVRQTRP